MTTLPSDPVEALHGLYPSVDLELLESVLAATGRDLASAEAVLREMLGLPAAPSSFSIMRPQSGRPLTAKTRKMLAQSKADSAGSATSQQVDNADAPDSRQGSGGKIRVASPMVAGVAVTRPTQSALWKRRQIEEDEQKGKRFTEDEEEGLIGSRDMLNDKNHKSKGDSDKSKNNADSKRLAMEQEFGKETDPVALAKALDEHFVNTGNEGSRSWPESASDHSEDEKDSQDADEDNDEDDQDSEDHRPGSRKTPQYPHPPTKPQASRQNYSTPRKPEESPAIKQQNNSGRRSPSPSTPPGNIDSEVRELFRYIALYQPHEVPVETVLKVFLPDSYIPTIGDPDPFIKIPPVKELSYRLGLNVLDEPCGMQSDPSVVDLALRRGSKEVKNAAQGTGLVRSVKLPSEGRAVDAWIKSVKELHSHNSSATIPPPVSDWDSLMQEWPSGFERLLPQVDLDISALDIGLDTCARMVLALLDIPVHKATANKKTTSKDLKSVKGAPAESIPAENQKDGSDCIRGLHAMFQLYSEFKASQHFAKMPG